MRRLVLAMIVVFVLAMATPLLADHRRHRSDRGHQVAKKHGHSYQRSHNRRHRRSVRKFRRSRRHFNRRFNRRHRNRGFNLSFGYGGHGGSVYYGNRYDRHYRHRDRYYH